MNKAIEFYSEILRKRQALQKSKSQNLKRDYAKSINRSMHELRQYCDFKNISVAEVIKRTETGIRNNKDKTE